MNLRRTLKTLTLGISSLLVSSVSWALDVEPYLRTAPQNQPRSEVGLDLAANAMNVRGGVSTRRIGTTTLILPQVVSTLALAPNLKFESKATFANWNAAERSSRGDVETRMTANSLLPMIAEVEGMLLHTATGELHRKFQLKMREMNIASLFSRPLLLRANASVEKIDIANANSSVLTGVETALVRPSASDNGFNRIRLKYATVSGADPQQREIMTVSHFWSQTKLLNLGVEYEMTRETAALYNTFKLSWQTAF